jgi:amino acid transporter
MIIILVGGFLVLSKGLTHNWFPLNDEGVSSFMPNGFSGVMLAVSGVFFAYIGFDAVSVLGEEAENPQRDLPKGMMNSLIICTIVYVLMTLVLTGAVDYKKFDGVGDPLSFIFEKENLDLGWMQFLVSLCAVVAMTSVLLVFQMGQPRIWMSISRDGLLPDTFQKIHPKYKTPSFATILTGLVVGVPLIFTDKTFVLDFTSIGTLFAFVLVCGGVLLIPKRTGDIKGFKMPDISAKYSFPALLLIAFIIVSISVPNYFSNLFILEGENINATFNISSIIFWIICIVLAILAFVKELSLIPLMGLTTCLYLLTGMTATNWLWFTAWLILGLCIYLYYGYRHSKLAHVK